MPAFSSKEKVREYFSSVRDFEDFKSAHLLFLVREHGKDNISVAYKTHGIDARLKDVVEVLIELGADVNFSNEKSFSSTPLMLAAIHNNQEIAEILIKKGADVNKVNDNNRTALSLICYSNESQNDKYYDMARFLLENGADPNINDVKGDNALIFSAAGSNPKTVKLLIEKGAKINHVATKGGSALHSACFVGNKEIIDILLESGADIEVKDSEGNNSFIVLLYSKNLTDKKELIELFLKKKPNLVNEKGYKKYSPLLFSLLDINFDSDVAKILLDNGADVNAKNEEGRTVLQSALASEKIKAPQIQTLVDYGAYIGNLSNDEKKKLKELKIDSHKDELKGQVSEKTFLDFEAKCNKGNSKAIFALGKYYLENQDPTESKKNQSDNKKRGLELIIQAARQLNVDAIFIMQN